MAFEGFSKETGAFLWDLSFNNERPWFEAHRETWERVLNRPFRALAAETLALADARWPERGFQVHVSRIYRDARRLFGRGPYKDHLWFILYVGGKHDPTPAFWFELGPAKYSYGLGFWDAPPAVMEAFRRRIDAESARFERIVDELGAGWKLWGAPYKRPKGERGEKLNPWYNRRSLSVGLEKDLGGEAFLPELPRVLVDCYGRLLPLFDFLWAAYRDGT
ncbi:MAG: DUF2461 domain-containing protein [Oscillospiraceae bacterium]|nr:DUF2461 domain-containing protein [Oscillospiraceae bacterium]